MKKLLIATHNISKYKTMHRFLQLLRVPYQLCSLADLNITEDVEETGKTFEENARLKANWYHQKTGLPTIADDSGLEIDALDGKPGVHTKRFAGENKTDEEHRVFMLNKLAHVPDGQRGACFVTAIAFINDHGMYCYHGREQGTITHASRGTPMPQFPFCSVFVPEEYTHTLAELYDAGKSVSDHRMKALDILARECLLK